jgi:Tfp pilus assembly protein PilX
MKRETIMRYSLFEKTIDNESGIVTIVALLVMVTLTIAGIVAVNISNNETGIVRNEQIWATDFYNTESGLNDARINYNNWLDNNFLTEDETTASTTFNTVAEDENGNSLANIQARCIATDNSGNVVAVFNNVADDIPAMSHTAPPPAGSGYSSKNFQIRRYSLTATSADGTTIVQTGVWKIFNKY